MSWLAPLEPDADHSGCPEAVELVIVPRSADLGGFRVQRVLPFRGRRTVGPFIFWDEMGPASFDPGHGLDVLPHPHIGLATITYLTRGALSHRDSLGTHQRIEPGAVNLMTAGAGIVHSERTGVDDRAAGGALAGIQSWLALPAALEDCAPDFAHFAAADLPELTDAGVAVRVMAGALGETASPIQLPAAAIYLDVELADGARFPVGADLAEDRAIYLLDGELAIDEQRFAPHRMLVLRPGVLVVARALTPARFLVLGGDVRADPTFTWWNFVATSKERIEDAKRRWLDGEFPAVPGDADERAPLPRF